MFDIVKKFNRRPQVCTMKLMEATLKSPVVASTCRTIEALVKGNITEVERQLAAATEPAAIAALEKEEKTLWDRVAAMKKLLPAFCFQAHFVNGKRTNASAVKSGLCMFDMDDVVDPRATYEETAGQIEDLGVMMVHITPSTRGLRYVFRTPEGMSIAEAQQWFASHIGVTQYDTCTKDLARLSFAVPESYVLKNLFLTAPEKAESPSPALPSREGDGTEKAERMKGDSLSEAIPEKTESPSPALPSREEDGTEKADTGECAAGDPVCFKGIPFTMIIDRLLLSMGVDGEPVEGERNTTLYNLVRQLRYICDFSQRRLMQVVPRWGMSEEEVTQTVASALATVRRTDLPPHLRRTLSMLEAQREEMADVSTTGDTEAEGAAAGLQPKMPPVPEHLPHLLHLLTKSYPEEYHAAILMAALPIIGTLATRARARYFDGAEHSPSFLTCIVAPQASGKSCTRRLVDMLLASLQAQDNGEREKERRWMDEKKARKNSKQQPEDPRARIRIVPATISNAMLFKRLDCSDGEHLFTYAEEIDTLSKGRRSGTWSQKDDIMRQAFDNSICGQDYMSDNSWSAMVKVFYNTLTCGTPVAVHRYYNDVEGGLVSRVCFSQLPDMLGAPLPIFGSLTKDEEEEVGQWARRLMAIGREPTAADDAAADETAANTTDGERATMKLPATKPVEYDIPMVKQAIWDWLEARRREYLETQENPALDIFRRRAAVIGFRAGLVGMLLCGEKETDDATEFATWVASYVLREQLDLFGEEMNRLMMEGERGDGTGQKATYYQSLLSALPEKFTLQDVIDMRTQAGYKSPVKQVIWRWKVNGLIISAGDGFRKNK